MIVKEACVDSLDRAILAEKNGADRIELCARLDLDGLSPSADLIESTCNSLRIPVMVMVRLREGNFIYSKEEMNDMIEFIKQTLHFPISGFVFGALTFGNLPAIDQTQRIVATAGDLDITFHKAIDLSPDPVESTKMLNATGISRILTSGGEATAEAGAETINKMQEVSEHTILAAGRITNANLPVLQKELHVSEFHGKQIVGNLYSV